MIAFATLLERLLFTQGRNDKIRLLRQYFETQPDPDRGLALAAIAGELHFATAKPGLILVSAGFDGHINDPGAYGHMGDEMTLIPQGCLYTADYEGLAKLRQGPEG